MIDQAAETRQEAVRIAEALLFAATEPLDDAEIGRHMAAGVDVRSVLEELREHYTGRGVNLARVAKRWYFRTAPDLGWLLSRDQQDQKKLSKAALETLAIVAYHQPVTRAEIEDIRGVTISRGTIDVLMETGWVRLRGRRKAPGRPVTYGTTESFLLHFGLENITDLPGLDELKSAGLFDGRLPKGFGVPSPSDDPELREDEDPLEGDLFDDLPLGEEGEPVAAIFDDAPVEAESAAPEGPAAAAVLASEPAMVEAEAEAEDGQGASQPDDVAEGEPEDEVGDEAEAGRDRQTD
ncbi:MAG: SMC-Scp complex subunit ScpB [Beijerinckiaceae bacterium]|nr:SMC-Scp complex subunit ScpB [Beijerinckiaceae bacterium]